MTAVSRSSFRELAERHGRIRFISAVPVREIIVTPRVGKLQAAIKEITGAVQREGFIFLGIDMPHLLAPARLPTHHRDPFDRLLIAQAIAADATFVSEARNAARYPIRCVTCSGG